MKHILTTLLTISLGLATGVWWVLFAVPAEALPDLSERAAFALFFVGGLGLLVGMTVLAFGDRCLQFFGAVAAVAALLGLAAFHSSYTHRARTRPGIRLETGDFATRQDSALPAVTRRPSQPIRRQ